MGETAFLPASANVQIHMLSHILTCPWSGCHLHITECGMVALLDFKGKTKLLFRALEKSVKSTLSMFP